MKSFIFLRTLSQFITGVSEVNSMIIQRTEMTQCPQIIN